MAPSRRLPRPVRWLIEEAADYLVVAWLIAGLVAITFFLASNPVVCIIALVAFVGVTLGAVLWVARSLRRADPENPERPGSR